MTRRDEVVFIVGVIVGAIAMACLAVPARGQDIGLGGDDNDGSSALLIKNLNIVGSWVVCAGGDKPLVTMTKSQTDDAYRVIVECPKEPAVVVPTS